MRRLALELSVLAAVVLLAACVRAPGASAAPDRDLLATVQAETYGDSVRFVLLVTNVADAPVELNFTSGQSFDFVVRRGDETLWTWSADRSFIQVLRTESLPAGDTRRYEATWTPPAGTSGELTVTGSLTASGRSVAQSAAFRLP